MSDSRPRGWFTVQSPLSPVPGCWQRPACGPGTRPPDPAGAEIPLLSSELGWTGNNKQDQYRRVNGVLIRLPIAEWEKRKLTRAGG